MDAVILASGAALTALLWRLPGGLGFLPAFVIGHFFLFCNVFRIRRRPELLWGAAYLLLCLLIAQAPERPFWLTYLAQAPVTLAVIGYEITRPTYHGVFSRRWNKRLREYLAGEI